MYDEIERMYKRAYNSMVQRGNHEEADRLVQEYESRMTQLRKEEDMALNSSLIGAAANTIFGSGGSGGVLTTSTLPQDYQNALMQSVLVQPPEAPAKYEIGVLYLDGKPMPDDWRGAYIDRMERSIAGSGGGDPRWIFSFKSKWSNANILLHLDANELSGKEADKVAETYKEALNQRRLG